MEYFYPINKISHITVLHLCGFIFAKVVFPSRRITSEGEGEDEGLKLQEDYVSNL